MSDRPDTEIVVDDAELVALADGQLDRDPLYRIRLERAISRSPVLARRARVFRDQTDALRRAYDSRLTEPVPARLLATLERKRPFEDGRRAILAAAVIVLAVGAGSAGWLAGKWQSARDNWMLDAVAATDFSRIRPAVAGSSHAGSIPTQITIPDWLESELTFKLHAPDLSQLGYELVAQKNVDVAGMHVLRLDYRAADGRVFNLFLRPRWDGHDSGFQVSEEDGVAFASWKEGPLSSAIAARLSRAETVAIAEAVRRALHMEVPERQPSYAQPIAEKAVAGPNIRLQ